MSTRDDMRRLEERLSSLERAFQILVGEYTDKKSTPIERQLHETASMLEAWTTHQEMQQIAALDVLASVTKELAEAGSEVTHILPITVFLDTHSPKDARTVSHAIRSLLGAQEFDLFFEGSGEWGSWFSRSFARSKRAMTSQGVKDTLARTERALEMQALLVPQAQIDAMQAEAAAKLIEALSTTTDAIVQIGSVLLVKVDGTPVVRNLTQVELSYLEHNKHLYRSPKDALEELARVSGDAGRFAPPAPGPSAASGDTPALDNPQQEMP